MNKALRVPDYLGHILEAICRIPDDRKGVLQTNADEKRTSLSWPSSGFCS